MWVVLEKFFNQAFSTNMAVIAFLCVYQSSRVIKNSFSFTISALVLLSSSRYWQKTHGLRLLLCIWLARKYRSRFSRLCKQTRMPHASLLLSWSFHLLAVCSLASFLTKTPSLRKSRRKTLSSAYNSLWKTHCSLPILAALFLLAYSATVTFAFRFVPFKQFFSLKTIQTALAEMLALILVIQLSS